MPNPKILIIKLGAMGDVLRTTAILPGLIEKYPEANITWVTKEDSLDIFHNNEYVNKIISFNDKNKIKNENFDIIINLDEDYEACELASLFKGKIFGFYLDNNKITPTESAQEYFNMSVLGKKPENDILKKKNKKTYQQLMFEIIGIKPKHSNIIYRLTKEQLKYAEHFARQFNIDRKTDYVIGLNTGSGGRWPSKRISAEKTAKLADLIYSKLKAKIILFGGKEEVERNNKIIALSKSPIMNAGCGNDLKEFPALISLCDSFVTSDSLGLHMALALKRKVAAFFGPTSSNEIEMYGLGKKIIPKSNCICCYKTDCKANEKIDINKILEALIEIKKQKLSIIITSFKEPKLTKAIDSIINQEISNDYELIVVAPDEDAKKIVEGYSNVNKNIRYFKDPGKGKSHALNLLFKEAKGDILILTDGDVYLSDNAIKEVTEMFKDPLMGCVSGRVMSSNPKDNMLGYWSHLLVDAGAHNIRKKLFSERKFLECSGYLFAFRNKIKEIPLDVAEDTIIPYMFWQEGYQIGYAENAKVFVRNPDNFKDWLTQRKRTSKAHETLHKYVDTKRFPRIKSFTNELKMGLVWAPLYPRNIKEFLWTMTLFPARLYMWMNVFYDTRFKKDGYQDAWERVHSTK